MPVFRIFSDFKKEKEKKSESTLHILNIEAFSKNFCKFQEILMVKSLMTGTHSIQKCWTYYNFWYVN